MNLTTSSLHISDVSSVTTMSETFQSASAFDQDLCAWGTKITSTDSTICASMFVTSGCPTNTDPDLTISPKGPFCHACLAPSTMPSQVPSKTPSTIPSSVPSAAPTPGEYSSWVMMMIQNRVLKLIVPGCLCDEVFGDKAALIAALENGDYSPTGPYGKQLI